MKPSTCSSTAWNPGTRGLGRHTLQKELVARAVGLSRLTGIVTAEGKSAFERTERSTSGATPQPWRTDRAARERCKERADRFGIDGVYLSVGALLTAPAAAIRDLLGAAPAVGLIVHATTGAYGLDAAESSSLSRPRNFPTAPSRVTTYEEGWAGLRAIVADPPAGHHGIAIHQYGSRLLPGTPCARPGLPGGRPNPAIGSFSTRRSPSTIRSRHRLMRTI